MQSADFVKYIKPGVHCHLLGIGGLSMSSLAEALHRKGLIVSGSDIKENAAIIKLRELGIKITLCHDSENINGVDVVVRSAACHDDNPEVIAARAKGIQVFERAQAWGAIRLEYKNAICVSGTHGKTTTTSMISTILVADGRDPSAMIGGTLPMYDGGLHIGGDDTIVMEACEFSNSYHNFAPTIAVIMNIEEDHLDFFKTLANIKKSFNYFASLVPENGCIVANGDDVNTMEAISGLDRKIITFGFGEGNDVRAGNINYLFRKTEFDIFYKKKMYAHVVLNVLGEHNVKDAIAAAATSIAFGVDVKAIVDGLASFSGAGRRYEFRGKLNGAHVYDDFAHHPSEIRALLSVAMNQGYKRVICIFQPYTYSRTRDLFDDFVDVLSLPDKLLLAEICPARETDTLGMSSSLLAEKIPGAECFATFEDIQEKMKEIAQEGDIMITVGCGDIYRVDDALFKKK